MVLEKYKFFSGFSGIVADRETDVQTIYTSTDEETVKNCWKSMMLRIL